LSLHNYAYIINFCKFFCVLLLVCHDFVSNLMSLLFYMFIYNYTLFVIFWVLQLFIITKFKTIYSFSELKYNFFFVIAVTICLLSMPPFMGFFAKILILITMIGSNFFFLYALFFVLLFFALYFYAQNIRFLFSTASNTLNYSFSINLRSPSIFFVCTYFSLFLLTTGFLYLEDFFSFFLWATL